MAANAANNAPDLVYVQRDQISSLASLGAIDPLETCIAGEGIAMDDCNDNSVGQATFADHVYGIPEFNQVQVTMANSDMLADNGLDIADVNGSNWGDLAANLNDPKVVEALEYATSLLEPSGGWAKVKSLRDAADVFGEGNEYATGQVGAKTMEQWYISVLNEVTPDAPVAFSPFVSQETGEPIAFGTGSAWAIPSRAKNKTAACRFIKAMTTKDTWMAAAKTRAESRKESGRVFIGLLTGNVAADKEIRETYVTSTGDPKWDAAIDAQKALDEGWAKVDAQR